MRACAYGTVSDTRLTATRRHTPRYTVTSYTLVNLAKLASAFGKPGETAGKERREDVES